jgi:hypothetical protein
MGRKTRMSSDDVNLPDRMLLQSVGSWVSKFCKLERISGRVVVAEERDVLVGEQLKFTVRLVAGRALA